MKKIVSLFVAISVFVSSSVVSFANTKDYKSHFDFGMYEYTHEYEEEHYNVRTVTYSKHPHSGYRICKCGMIEYYDNTYSEECDICYDEWKNFEGVDEYWEHEHSYDSVSWSHKHPHSGKRKCYCGFVERFSKSYDVECKICENEGVSQNPDEQEKISFNGKEADDGHIHKADFTKYTVEHPHRITYKCKCGFSWDSGAYKKEEDCNDCLNGQIGVYTATHKCTYNYDEYISDTHPHEVKYYCSCGNVYEQSKLFLPDCQECQNHVHTYNEVYYSIEHPHQNFYECYCGTKEYIVNSYATVSECIECQKNMNMAANHVHDFSAYYCEAEHPHWEFYECTCGAREYLDNQRATVTNCEECIAFEKSHTHNFVNRYHYKIHPHDVYISCECGAYSNLGYYEKLRDCAQCQEELRGHTHDFSAYYYEAEHPHWEFYECTCGAREYLDNQRATVTNCEMCIAFEKTHKHSFVEQLCYKSHPHQNYLRCSCGAYSQMNIYTYFESCQQCIIEKAASENAEPEYILNGRPVTKEEYYSVGSDEIYYSQSDYDDEVDYYNMPVLKNNTGIDIRAISQQIVLGEYAPKTTALGTAGEVIVGLLGIDAWKDITDMVYYLTHWENNWDHYAKVLVNGAAILPGIGVLKNADEVKAVRKYIEASDIVAKKIKSLSNADIVRLASKAVDPKNHAYTKHVGKSASEMKAMLKTNKWGDVAEISSFTNSKIADEAISKAVKNNTTAIANGLASGNSSFAIEYDMKKVIGKGYFKNSDKLQNATKVRVVVKKTGAHDFVIRTAFPVK